MKLSISPKLDRGDGKNMCQDIIDLKKLQSIRSKPIEAGTKLQIWAMWRGMRKGIYCPFCWRRMQPDKLFCENHICSNHYATEGAKHYSWEESRELIYPKKLLDAITLEPIPIQMKYEEDAIATIQNGEQRGKQLVIKHSGGHIEFVHECWDKWETEFRGFAKKDGFKNYTACIDFFSTYLKKEWNPMWINRWKPNKLEVLGRRIRQRRSPEMFGENGVDLEWKKNH